MGRGILKAQLSRFEEIGKRVEESSAGKRREGFNLTYEVADAVKRAFGLLLMLAALAVKLLKCSHIERTADYVSANMSVLFVPTSVYVLECYPRIKAVVIPLILITLVSMAVTFFASYVTVHIVRRLLERRASAEKKTA
ncbi:MAG: hypothetical protein Ta2A_08600 [Treponemataceae bacterium]|nr:MAG: hypothetical protein Ta2A_08600 [Treponemataceae bacterium]